jgi:hypothetical protein
MTLTTTGVPMAGMYAINTDAKYIDPKSSVKHKKTKKTTFSPFMNKSDASKQHITGIMDNAGKKKSKIEEKIDSKIRDLLND